MDTEKNRMTDSEEEFEELPPTPKIKASRSDFQIARRLFHLGNGVITALLYLVLFERTVAISILGFFAGVFYIFEQVRLNYPEYANKFEIITQYFYRAEETLKESAMIPYVMGLLLTIIIFPKSVALAAILTLATADPFSALVGIRFGKHKWAKNKSMEGSGAFFVFTLISVFLPLYYYLGASWQHSFLVGLITSLCVSAFELIPIRLDDNLTIPLVTGTILWIFAGLFGIPLTV